ncbi:FAD binding domain-containing protein (plasmid) [Phyllobacteriaceae bacterium JZ32]
MKPAAFDFVRPQSLEEALETLQQVGGDARVLAGGQSLVPMLNMRLARPSVLIDIMRLPELRTIDERKGEVTIGAGVRQAQLEAWPHLASKLPLIARAIGWIGHVQTRARGTVCGSIAHADPSAELPLALIALSGSVRLRSKKKTRTVKADDFFLGMMSTGLREGEMIEAVSFPVIAPGTGVAFREVGRRHGDFAIAACAAIAGPDGVRLAVAGVDDRPRSFAIPTPEDASFEEALNEIAWSLNARGDIHASARYRRELVRRLGRRTIEEACRCRG